MNKTLLDKPAVHANIYILRGDEMLPKKIELSEVGQFKPPLLNIRIISILGPKTGLG